MVQKQTNYWPQSIAALLFAAALLIVWTVIQTSTMPVHEENNFMKQYQRVDLNADEILQQNRAFFNEYEVVIASSVKEIAMENAMYKKRNRTTLQLDPAQPVIFEINAKNGAVKEASMQVLLTRPTSTAEDRQLSVEKLDSNRFGVDLGTLGKPGRWQLVTKTTASGKTGYKNFDLWIDE